MGKKLGAIFFDAGNTLVFPLFGKLVDRMASLGYPVTAEEFFKAERIGKQSLGKTANQRIERIGVRMGQEIPSATRPRFSAAARQVCRRLTTP